MTQSTAAREVRLTAHVGERPELRHFEIAEVPVPVPGPGQILVRNRYLALRAAMGLLMNGPRSPMPPYRPGEVMWGPAIGEIVAGDGTPGALVAHALGWREYALLEAAEAQELPDSTDPVVHLGQAETAYVGLVAAARLRPGDTVFVSSAAGSVGTMVGQIARRISLQGFTAHDHPEVRRQGREQITGWLREGRLTVPVTRIAGLPRAPRALLELLEGAYTGTVIVEV